MTTGRRTPSPWTLPAAAGSDALRALRCAVIGLAVFALTCALLPTGPAVAADNAKEAAKRLQEQIRLQMQQAEERRKQAEQAAKRAAEEAARLRKEQEARRIAAAKQAEALAKAQAAAAAKAQAAAAASAKSATAAKSSTTAPKTQPATASAAAKPAASQSNTSTTAKQADKSKDVEKDEENSKDNDKDGDDDKADAAHGSNNAATDIVEGPPATVEQMLKNMFGSKPAPIAIPKLSPVVSNKPAEAPSQPKPRPEAAKNAAASVAITPAGATNAATKAPPVRRPESLPMPAFPQDVLAVNVSPESLAAARALGFSAAPSSTLLNLNVAVTRLTPPNGMSADDARRLLNQKIPQSQFALNQKYRIIRAASDAGDSQGSSSTVAPARLGGPPCVHDRCFAREAINWKPDLKRCAAGLKIGVIDTAVDVTHPAFAHKNLQVRHLAQSGKPGPDWHGTGVTALLAGDSNSGTPGLLPDAAYYVADIFNAGTDNLPVSDTMSMLRAFDWLESEHVRIINMSLAGPPDELIRQAIEKLAAKGVLFVAAAGNEGPHAGPSFPAAYDQVIAVTAINKDLQSYRNANRGAYVDVAAPGVAIWTALPGRKEGYHSGTSFATPYVTAALATLYPHLPTKTADAALRRLRFKDLGAPGKDPIYGQGLMVAPQGCGAGAEVADSNTPTPASATSSAAGFVTTTSPASRVARPASGGEALPWLGFQSGQ